MPVLHCKPKAPVQGEIVFLHIPKTGGCAVEQALRPLGRLEHHEWKARTHASWERYGHSPQHCTLRQLRELGVTCDASTRAFAVVRPPVERVVSEYNRMTLFGRVARDTSFDDFLDQFLDRSEAAVRRWDAHQLDCAEYLLDESGQLSADIHIIHYSRDGLLADVAAFLLPHNSEAQEHFCKTGHQAGGSGALSADDVTTAQRARIDAFFALDNTLLFANAA